MGILFSAPRQEFEIIREEWLESVEEIASHGVFVGGTVVARFEREFAAYTGTQGAVGVGNGTDALFLALKALGIGPGDEVITAANTFIATVEAIHHTGALPVLADCDPATFLIDTDQVKRLATPRTKAIIPVHLYGQMVDLDDIAAWAEARGIHIVEDSAQAAGASLNGRAAGSMGAMGCFSFYPDKNLGALGDGGMVVSSSPDGLARLKRLRNHGGEVRYQHDMPGFNSRLDPIQAGALSIKLRYLDEWSATRRKVAAWYGGYLEKTGGVILPASRDDNSHVYHLYVIRVDGEVRDKLRKHLQKQGILTAVHYPLPVHLTPAFSHLGYGPGSFPAAELCAEQIVSLPMHIAMSEEHVSRISGEIHHIVG